MKPPTLTLNDFAQAWMAMTAEGFGQGIVVMAAVMLFLALFRKGSPVLRYSLLILILLKFAIPPIFEAPFGLFPAMQWSEEATISPIARSSITVAVDSLSEEPPFSPAAWAFAIQCLGALALIAVVLTQAVRLRKRLKSSRSAIASVRRHEVYGIMRRIGLRRMPEVKVCDGIDSPQTGGLLKSFIMLPAWIDQAPRQERRIILAHELAHIKRRDNWVNAFQILMQIGLWWNPLVWWLNARIRAQREVCCDDLVLNRGIADGRAYSRTLLNVAARATKSRPLCAAIGMASSFGTMDERIRRALDEGLPRKRSLSPIALLGVAVLAIGILPGRTSPAARAETPSESKIERGMEDHPTFMRGRDTRAPDAKDDTHPTKGEPEMRKTIATLAVALALGGGSVQSHEPGSADVDDILRFDFIDVQDRRADLSNAHDKQAHLIIHTEGDVIIDDGQIIIDGGQVMIEGGRVLIKDEQVMINGGRILIDDGQVMIDGGHVIIGEQQRVFTADEREKRPRVLATEIRQLVQKDVQQEGQPHVLQRFQADVQQEGQPHVLQRFQARENRPARVFFEAMRATDESQTEFDLRARLDQELRARMDQKEARLELELRRRMEEKQARLELELTRRMEQKQARLELELSKRMEQKQEGGQADQER